MSKYGRRWGFLLLIASLALSLGAVATAAPTITTVGTSGPDRLHGNRGPDIIYGKQGDDVIWTGTSGELGTASPGRVSEYAYGGTGDDRLNSWSEAQDTAYLDGGPGVDRCRLSPNDVAVNCEVVEYKDGPDREVGAP